jgi:uracil-DNA glycosylase
MPCHYWEGDPEANVVFIFSAPGQEEADNDRPVAGDTGENMDRILRILNQEEPDIFPSICRYYYRITNAYTASMWRARDGRSEADNQQILSEDNIRRVLDEIGQCQYVVLSGQKAQLLSRHIRGRMCLMTCHFGPVGLRRTYRNDCAQLSGYLTGSIRDQRRIQICAEELLNQFQD